MELDEYIAAVERDAQRLAAAARDRLDARVPSCPDWTMSDLLAHQGGVHRWAAFMVETGPTERPKRTQRGPEDGEDAVRWFEEGAASLVRTLRTADPAAPVWTFFGVDQKAFWFRRQAHETSVHRWDAENAATGTPSPIDAELAADGIDEVLSGFVPLFKRPGNGETFHFHRTDGDGEWLVTATPEGPVTERTHAKGDLAVRGSASDLVLFLWDRIPADRLEVFGDEALVSRWFELGRVG